jgi:hypothetical protein
MGEINDFFIPRERRLRSGGGDLRLAALRRFIFPERRLATVRLCHHYYRKPRRAIRFGTASRPFMTSLKLQTSSSLTLAPMKTKRKNRCLFWMAVPRLF